MSTIVKFLASLALILGVASAASAQVTSPGGSGGTTNITAVGGNAVTTTVPVSGTISCTNCSGTGASTNEDTASVNLEILAPMGAIRKATPANTSGADGDWEGLQMNAGRLWVDASGVTLTVGSHPVTNAGTFAVQAAQSGTWTVQPGNTANTTAWLVAGGKTNNNAAPGATNLGALIGVANAAAPSWTEGNMVGASFDLAGAMRIAGAISCSNCTGSGASKVDDAAFTIATDSVAPAGFLFDDVTPDSVNEGDVGLARMSANRVPYSTIRDAAGNERGANVTANNELLVELGAGAASIGTLGANSGVDIGDVTVNNAAGTAGVFIQGGAATDAAVAGNPVLSGGRASVGVPTDVSADGDAVPFWTTLKGALHVADGGSSLTIDGTITADKGTGWGTDITSGAVAGTSGPQGMILAEATTPAAVDDGDAVRPWATLNGAAAAFAVAHSVGGCTPDSSISTSAVMETEIKGTAGQLYSLVVTNLDTTPVYARLYNDTAANVDQTDTPVQRYLVPSGAGVVLPIPVGMQFSTAITARVTTGIADSDTGALTANEVLLSYCYK